MSDRTQVIAAAIGVTAGASLLAYMWCKRLGNRAPDWIMMKGFQEKRAAMLRSTTLSELLVITDFDATITTGDSDQCHDLCGFSKVLDADFRKAFAPLLDWEENKTIDTVEWWYRAHNLMVKHGQPQRQLIPRLVRESKMKFRPRAQALLKRLATLNVPVLIVSAGLSDMIEEFLRQNDALTENVTVCSNRLNYAADRVPQSFCPEPPITSYTKASAYRASSTFFEAHANRTTLLVLGDSCTDIDSAENVPYKHMLTIGFLNAKRIEDAPKHAEAYDALVLGNHGSLSGVEALVDDVYLGTWQAEKLVKSGLSGKSSANLAALADIPSPSPAPAPPTAE